MSKICKGEILEELRLNSSNCTDTIKVRPIMSGDWLLIPPELTNGQKQHQYDFTTLIAFDRRQVWEVYYCDCRDGGMWVAERNGIYLRMPAKDFERFFGKYKILPKNTFSAKSPEFGCKDMTAVDDLTSEELQELERHIKEIKGN